ncbi:hypothetical protein [Mycolicibacterium chlorophenolicum]|nr:hypothetical protein [Mycolicibacterium chlorophenolicum]
MVGNVATNGDPVDGAEALGKVVKNLGPSRRNHRPGAAMNQGQSVDKAQ